MPLTTALTLLALLIYPGFAFATIAGLLYQGLSRKLVARAQRRSGPPLLQPFYDVAKLFSKAPTTVSPLGVLVSSALPILSIAFPVIALTLMPLPGSPFPVLPLGGSQSRHSWDLIVVLYLLEMPTVIQVVAGYGSRSVYGQLGASRRAQLYAAYGVPYLIALVGLAGALRTFDIGDIAAAGSLPVAAIKIIALTVALFCLPGRLGLNPFSMAEANAETLGGPLVEFSGLKLGLFRVGKAVEWVAAVSLVVILFVPLRWAPGVNFVIYAAASLIIIAAMAVVQASSARVKLEQALRVYWIYGLPLASLVVIGSVIVGGS